MILDLLAHTEAITVVKRPGNVLLITTLLSTIYWVPIAYFLYQNKVSKIKQIKSKKLKAVISTLIAFVFVQSTFWIYVSIVLS